jgi:hypothetical protein
MVEAPLVSPCVIARRQTKSPQRETWAFLLHKVGYPINDVHSEMCQTGVTRLYTLKR